MKTLWHNVQDAVVVFTSAWFILLFDLLALLAFLAVAQGRDVLLVIMENTGNALEPGGLHSLWQILGLCLALLFWSTASEFGSRFIIYLADNSGHSLDPQRVFNRKKFQHILSRLSLFFPVVLMLCAMISVYWRNYRIMSIASELYQLPAVTHGFVAIIALLVMVFALLWLLYPGGLIVRLSRRNSWLNWLHIGTSEREWAGIFGGKPAERVALNAHFGQWLQRLEKDTSDTVYRISKQDSIPVIFISAEGGALRTGAFTGLLLAHLQEQFPKLKNYIYAFSSVSGGTVGSDFFNAQIIESDHPAHSLIPWHTHAKVFFQTDFLAAVTAKLVFGEVINCFSMRDIFAADRAIALEDGFEQGWTDAYGKDSPNVMAGSFDQTNSPGLPAVFINTTEVETGLQDV